MILPFITPNDNDVFSLLQLIRWRKLDSGDVECTFTGGVKKTFTGPAAEIVSKEIVFAVNTYRQFQAGMQQAANGGPLIVPAVNGAIQ